MPVWKAENLIEKLIEKLMKNRMKNISLFTDKKVLKDTAAAVTQAVGHLWVSTADLLDNEP